MMFCRLGYSCMGRNGVSATALLKNFLNFKILFTIYGNERLKHNSYEAVGS